MVEQEKRILIANQNVGINKPSEIARYDESTGKFVGTVVDRESPGAPGAARGLVRWNTSIFVADFTLALSLVAAAFIDIEHMYVPNLVSMGGTVLGVATFSLRPPLTWADSLIGAAVGFGTSTTAEMCYNFVIAYPVPGKAVP